jgi:cobalt-zinc-cadmium efflux system protein
MGGAHDHDMSSERKLGLTFSITLFVLVAEVVGGYVSNSLALLSDAGHVFTDALALGLSLAAARLSRMPQDSKATYGYHRIGILAATINGLALLIIAVIIFKESFARFSSPPDVDLAVMMPIAAFGFAANLLMVKVLGTHHEDLNVRSAWLHVLGDTLSSAGVLVSGAVLYFTGWKFVDPLAGVFIGLVIISGGARVIWESLEVFLDLAPKGFDVEEIAKEIVSIEGVRGIHHLHLRTLAHKRVMFSAHVWVDDQKVSSAEKIQASIKAHLLEMGIAHVTLQLETGDHEHKGIYCDTCSSDGHHHEGDGAHGEC